MSHRINPLLPESTKAPLKLTPSHGEPELPGMAEWRAKQKKRAEADLLTRELSSFKEVP